ncbi:MAG: hypothetical protein NTX73_18215 [Rhodobacterales bacterium]|nr:hypothetical protein [Rhodobacterales bacterium]
MQDNRAPDSILRSLISANKALLILGVQRRGTTLLGEDISSLRVRGYPSESFPVAESVSGPKEAQSRRLAELGTGEDGQ